MAKKRPGKNAIKGSSLNQKKSSLINYHLVVKRGCQISVKQLSNGTISTTFYHILILLKVLILRTFLEFTSFCCFLYGNGNCYCSTNHWVVTHSETICFSMLYYNLICRIILINIGFTRNGL